ncbi:hypothetical protein KC19_12G174900 [Ceratodon purpureus]|uniref:Uncharacterized protein n=1 Tax=Ceratodon purpureus TaxID=3225 RepID=A0A8T0GBZ0_CERPU|nr:hypothetical protein KC19_12G174900 [Ceratodon purpureus]KAG0555520.1 hypothetical protein KC19_12G174900 [Ceratodon purpureus]KAG0555521.1 hypothetical protein KC19_12G174900 [Ceratodon purpureus]
MVVVQPACCNQARWTTTNSEYGDFYVSIHKEVKREPEPVVHKECTKKADVLGKELSDVKAQLECLKQRCQRDPCPKTGFVFPPGSTIDPNLFSPKIGKCHCPSGPGPPNSNPYISVCKNEFNGAKKHDPQFLEQHIKTEHPRLVKRVHPPKPYSAPCITGSGDHFLGDDKNECGSRSGSRSDSERPRHCKMIGLYKRTNTQCPSTCGSYDKSFNNNVRIRVVGNNGNNGNISRSDDNSNLNSRPTTDQRYNFYKYYGYAGKGAKTSKGWHSKLRF